MHKKNHLMMLLVLAGAMALVSPVSQAAHVMVSDEYVRLAPPVAANSAGYLTIRNHEKETITLKSIDSEIALRTEIHGHTMKDGVMKMFRVDGGLPIKPGQNLELKPGGYHIMLMGLKKPLEEGSKVNVTLHFSDGDAVDLKLPVREMVHSAAESGHHHHH
ncbi:MAG: copper chaperone PCu(A)C [Endozoicomonas sp.]